MDWLSCQSLECTEVVVYIEPISGAGRERAARTHQQCDENLLRVHCPRHDKEALRQSGTDPFLPKLNQCERLQMVR